MLHDLTNDDGFVALKYRHREKVCQKPTLQQKTSDDDYYN